MTAKILDGRAVSAVMRRELHADIAKLEARKIKPGLGVLLVGDNPASRSYVSAKEKACTEMGFHSREIHLAQNAKLADITAAVRSFNEDPNIHGFLVQLPLPDASMELEVLSAVDPAKDVDCFHPLNVGRMMLGLPTLLPCTPLGILHLLDRSGVSIEGAHVVIIGRSRIVGRPLAHLLSQKGAMGNASVTICHSVTRNLGALTGMADIVIAAAGRPNVVTADMIRPGTVVVDVGVNRVPDTSCDEGYRLVGDVDFENVKKKASAITPVPGGIGPMTITMLLYNTVQAAKRFAKASPAA